MSPDDIKYIVNHLFLPPELPQEDDRDVDRQQALLTHIVDSAVAFYQSINDAEVDMDVRRCWYVLYKMLRVMCDIRQGTIIPVEELRKALVNMKIDDIVCLHISKQNSGVILRKCKTEIMLELFQASPTAEAVAGNIGKLCIQFPSRPRLSIPNDPRAINSLCTYLADMDFTEMPNAIPITKKAGSSQHEDREVPDIRYISELLGGIARALTSDVDTIASSTVYVTKRINDHVLWKSVRSPWRRDPQWLVIRVALQTTLAERKIDERYGYKAFITYVLSRALEKACQANVDHDLLFVMNAKIATRIWKLRSLVDTNFPFDYIVTQSETCNSQLEGRWKGIQAVEARPLAWAAPTRDEIHSAKRFALTKSRAYLSTVYNRSRTLQMQTSVFTREVFEKSLNKNSVRRRRSSPPAEISNESTGVDLWLAVFDVESWIVNNLPGWMTSTRGCMRLATLKQLITRHDLIATSLSKNPELFSRVFLIILELWVALDKTVIELLPLIKEYSPELSIISLEPLILPELCQMKRLQAVEKYLERRHSIAKYQQHSLFKFIKHRDSFAARYFEADNSLQHLRHRILSEAEQLKSTKERECTRLNDKYYQLQHEYGAYQHQYVDSVDRRGKTIRLHSSGCLRCAMEYQANALRVDVFEWPLPEDEILSRLVVFELHLPEPFGVWRDVTYGLARRYSSTTSQSETSPTIVLKEYTAFQRFLPQNLPSHTVTIAATTKSFLDSHYRACSLPCEEEQVIKNHPFHYQLFDNARAEWLPSVFPTIAIRKQCSPKLPPGPYERLAWTLTSTTHTPNMVISRQSRCATELSYHEWEAFGNIRSGHRLQWRNMMLELVKDTLSLGNPAVHILFRQAAWQVEQQSDMDHRESHLDLVEASFGREVVIVLHKRLDRISENWQEGWTAATLSVLACRLFSLSSSPEVRTDVLRFLARLREILFDWMDQVLSLLKNQDLQEDPMEEYVTDRRNRVIQLAASYRSTYMLELDEISSIFKDQQSVSAFIKCAIVLQNNIPEKLHSLPTPLHYLVERDMVFSIEVADALKQSIDLDTKGLECAIRSVWSGFQRDPSRTWRYVGDRWIMCETMTQDDVDQTCYVYLNLLDGTFLVNGKTLGNLPKEILQHSLFQTLFPHQSTMDIVPSTMRGMVYQLSRNVQNRLEVHFALAGSELLIRTRDIHSRAISEFVPADTLQGDIPNALLVNTVHLFHESPQSLSFYPAPLGWDPSAIPAWTMRFTADPFATITGFPNLTEATTDRIGNTTNVLSPDTGILKRLSAIFQPLETSVSNLLVTWRPSQASTSNFSQPLHGELQISLPRYRLTFSVSAQGDIKSKELPGMSVSAVQSIRTLFGLRSMLVLQGENALSRIIVPDGAIVLSQSHHHTKPCPEVTIVPHQDAGAHIRMFIYDVDELVGRLIGDGTLTSWYLLAYLHILTSSCLCDPLTCRTGVQQALTMLRSANSFAFMELSAEHMKFLQLILEVTPIRTYYPPYLTSMEKVDWHPVLSPLSQSELFVPLVEAILEHGNNQALFQPEVTRMTVKYKGNIVLRKRAEFRNSRLVFNDCEQIQHPDHIFSPACCLNESSPNSVQREHIVVQTAALVDQWVTHPDVPHDLWKEFQTWEEFSTHLDTSLSFDNPKAWLRNSPSKTWFSLFTLCLSASRENDLYGLMFALGIISYRSDMGSKLANALLTVAINIASMPPLREARRLFPSGQTFNLAPGHILEAREIQDIADACCIDFETSPEARLARIEGESQRDAASRRQHTYRWLCERQCQSLAMTIFQRWPNSIVQMPTDASAYRLINMRHFEMRISELFSSRYNNRRLFEHTCCLGSAFDIIRNHRRDIVMLPPCPGLPLTDTAHPKYVGLTLGGLLRSNDRPAPVPIQEFVALPKEVSYGSRDSALAMSTRNLLSRFSEGNSSAFPSRYTDDLSRCVDALENQTVSDPSYTPHRRLLPMDFGTSIQKALEPQTVAERMVSLAGLWPSLGPDSLLSQLSRHLREEMHDDWQTALILYAEGLAATQREKRLAAFKRPGLEAEHIKEAENFGGQGWDAHTYPDWLLIQLDANLLIRPVQASIANEMMSPESRQNTVMQLNMGEGKSSVIVPIVSAALANGEQLVRVIVLKPLCAQMFHLLKQRLCGLANRRLFYLPFSRNISSSTDTIGRILDLFKACTQSGGVLLCQPEHILSFQLMGLHSLCNTKDTEEAGPLIKAQRWLSHNTRDILDESDEILNVRYQLIYTLGAPRPLQNQPDRWQTIQEIFSLLKENLAETASRHPDWLELEHVGPERFPRMRILTQECGHSLLTSIARQIVLEERMPSTPFRSYPATLRDLALQFLTEVEITQTTSDALEEYSENFFGQLLLLRGLLAHGILLLSLKEKRWRVDYGLDPSRSMLAVPYRAKDCPATRAEFGHPDMILVLTCLSYYYGGLSEHQLETTFHHLFSTDNPDLRYEDWIKGYSTDFPASLRNLRGLNLDDTFQKYHHIFPRLRYNKAVIDFYLSECVFPKEAKGFQYKLTTNPWDLARKKPRLITGFSGTNDHSYLLPLSIHQLDSSDQRHTNAQVLGYLLRNENRTVVHTGSNVTALRLIEHIVEQDPPVMVLLDVGAQVLELPNKDVAREWLDRHRRASVEAAIYCDPTNDEFYVLSRDGRVEPLASSLYRTQLNKTLVYLDEARTRGTDFKFPVDTRAVVTLGPKLSKDKLIQGCMRMRKLGSRHSVLFFASSEISRKIQACIGGVRDDLDSSDVLLWAMRETCAQITDNGALWASQGFNFDKRCTAWEKYNTHLSSLSDLATVLREQESRTLEELYGVSGNDALVEWPVGGENLTERQQAIQTKCREFGIFLSRSSVLLEEQERELAHEKEDERQVERVRDTEPLEHSIDDALVPFIRTGTTSRNFLSLADCLKETSHYLTLQATSRSFFQSTNLSATEDFSRTIKLTPGNASGSMNDFLRPVQWVLRLNNQPNLLLLISPFEANALLPNIRISNFVRLHLYSPRVSRQTRSLEGLDFCVVPRPPSFTPPAHREIQELNLFAGQLFFYDRESFKEVCCMLGLHLGVIPDALKGAVDASGFVKSRSARRRLSILGCAFDASPVAFVRELIGWRRKGLGLTLTHVGQILHGNNLHDSEFV